MQFCRGLVKMCVDKILSDYKDVVEEEVRRQSHSVRWLRMRACIVHVRIV